MFVLFWFHLVSRMFDLAYFRAFFAGVPWPHAARGHRQTFISRHAGPRIRCSCTRMLVPSMISCNNTNQSTTFLKVSESAEILNRDINQFEFAYKICELLSSFDILIFQVASYFELKLTIFDKFQIFRTAKH